MEKSLFKWCKVINRNERLKSHFTAPLPAEKKEMDLKEVYCLHVSIETPISRFIVPATNPLTAMTKDVLLIQNITHETGGMIESMLEAAGIEPYRVDLSKGERIPDPRTFQAIVVLGGPQSANDQSPAMLHLLDTIRTILEQEISYLGICLGMQALVKAAGGSVVKSPVKEIGTHDGSGIPFSISLTDAGRADPLFRNMESPVAVYQLHGETVVLPECGTTLLATGTHCHHQAVRAGNKAYGLQCHVELTRDLLTKWIRHDADLRLMDKERQLEQFDTMAPLYRQAGSTLIANFMATANLPLP